MASEVLGSTTDLHPGGEDLRLPHQDNESSFTAYSRTVATNGTTRSIDRILVRGRQTSSMGQQLASYWPSRCSRLENEQKPQALHHNERYRAHENVVDTRHALTKSFSSSLEVYLIHASVYLSMAVLSRGISKLKFI